MKINPLYQSDIVSRYTSGATSISPKTETSRTAMSSDSVELSSGAQNYAQLLHQARSAMSTSESAESARADEIAKQISGGTYQVSDDDLMGALTGKSALPKYC
jgi:Anti-sigma-28 factor, FlgM.